MANVKELKARIEGVQETRKITNAMYLVASTKLRHAREALDRTRPYFDAMRQEVERVFHTGQSAKSRYFFSAEGEIPKKGVCGILVITADKGLAGAYNLNALRKAEEILKEKPDARLFVVGEYGRRHFRMRHRPFETDFRFTAQDPTFNRARQICTQLLDLYDNKELNEIVVVYTEMKSSLSTETMLQHLLPMSREPFAIDEADENDGQFEFLPSFDTVLSAVMRSYIRGFIYSALVDSFCSEQNSRVTAMDAAGRNAEELLSDLSLQLNRERQSAITQEITEISAGAMAQRRNNNGREAST
ncbi:MAG: ATP synthase F1 subunit gamma [Oscillibacter sp.]|nr:ATP synthase F1 subunit gamma [Oscillibacter sp.]